MYLVGLFHFHAPLILLFRQTAPGWILESGILVQLVVSDKSIWSVEIFLLARLYQKQAVGRILVSYTAVQDVGFKNPTYDAARE